MRSGSIKIGIFIILLSMIIYFVKNREYICKVFNEKVNNKKVFLNIIYTIILLIIIFCLMYIIKICMNFFQNNDTIDKNNICFEEGDKKIEEENRIYSELIKKEYENQKYDDPYLPEDFSYVEGTWKDGYVIQDKLGNQYVWVPCTNEDVNECVKLERYNKSAFPFINYNFCYNEDYEKFLKSALENGGFYISRYELGKENETVVSKSGVELLTNITIAEAKNLVLKMHDNINCELINGYAYDTTLKWIEQNIITKNIIEIDNNEKIITGRNATNNIYDFCDNILEYSLEKLYDTIIVRGVVNSKSTEYTNNIFSKESRYCMTEQETEFGGIIPVGIRTILYK